MNKTKVIFFGTPEFARRILNTLIEENYEVVAAVSQPDRPVGRKHIIQPTPVHELCIEHNIPCLQPEKLSTIKEEISKLNPDLILTCAYGQFIPQSILDIPTIGSLNIHPSLLPKYRGGAPIQHAVMNGDTETGVCLMEVVKAMDAGDIYACVHTYIGENETFSMLNERLMDISEQLVRDALPKYLRGELTPVAQDESKVVLGYNITKEEEQVHFSNENVKQIYNHIRGLIDWPIAYGMIDGNRIKFYHVQYEEKEMSVIRGTILGFENHAMIVACEGGILMVYSLQMQGKKQMDADAFANGVGRELIGKVFD